MRRIRVLTVVAAFVLPLVVAAPGDAHSFIPRDFGQLVEGAEQIFIGTVESRQARVIASGAIVTDVAFSNVRFLKGGTDRSTVIVSMLGGTVDGVTLKINGWPRFERGTTYVLFVKGNGRAMLPTVGGDQGIFTVTRDPATSAPVVSNAYGGEIAARSVRQAVAAVAGEATPRKPFRPALDAFVQAIAVRREGGR